MARRLRWRGRDWKARRPDRPPFTALSRELSSRRRAPTKRSTSRSRSTGGKGEVGGRRRGRFKGGSMLSYVMDDDLIALFQSELGVKRTKGRNKEEVPWNSTVICRRSLRIFGLPDSCRATLSSMRGWKLPLMRMTLLLRRPIERRAPPSHPLFLNSSFSS